MPLRSVLVVNPKGGSGKTTVATNLAGGLAARGEQVYLWDLDRQQSSLMWLSMRPRHVPMVNRLDQRDEEARAESWQRTVAGCGFAGGYSTARICLMR